MGRVPRAPACTAPTRSSTDTSGSPGRNRGAGCSGLAGAPTPSLLSRWPLLGLCSQLPTPQQRCQEAPPRQPEAATPSALALGHLGYARWAPPDASRELGQAGTERAVGTGPFSLPDTAVPQDWLGGRGCSPKQCSRGLGLAVCAGREHLGGGWPRPCPCPPHSSPLTTSGRQPLPGSGRAALGSGSDLWTAVTLSHREGWSGPAMAVRGHLGRASGAWSSVPPARSPHTWGLLCPRTCPPHPRAPPRREMGVAGSPGGARICKHRSRVAVARAVTQP